MGNRRWIIAVAFISLSVSLPAFARILFQDDFDGTTSTHEMFGVAVIELDGKWWIY